MVRKVEESGVVAASSSDLTKAQHLIAGGLAGAAATLVSKPSPRTVHNLHKRIITGYITLATGMIR